MKKELLGTILVFLLIAISLAGCISDNNYDGEDNDKPLIIHYTIIVINNSDENVSVQVSLHNITTNEYINAAADAQFHTTETIGEFEFPEGRYIKYTNVKRESEESGTEGGGNTYINQTPIEYEIIITNESIKA